MRVLGSIYVNIGYLDESISDVSKLEILILRHSYVEMEMPFESISKLTKLKAVVLNSISRMTNPTVPDSICDLKYIKHLALSFTEHLEYFPFDCIVESWTELTFFQFEALPAIQQFSNQLWNLPNLKRVILDFCNFDSSYFEFDTFNGFSSSLEVVSLNGNDDICDGNITVDNITYYGFGYLWSKQEPMGIFSAKDVLNDESNLLEFIQTFDPCYPPCNDGIAVCIVLLLCDVYELFVSCLTCHVLEYAMLS